MKNQRQNAIREVLSSSLVTNQDELRRKLRRRGFAVTQATLSRDIHDTAPIHKAWRAMLYPTAMALWRLRQRKMTVRQPLRK